MARLLIIEDNPSNLELMTYLLTKFGHECLTASSGQQGLQVAKDELPDLILCDIQLPYVDGYGVVRILKGDSSLTGIPVIAVSSYAMHGDEEKAIAAGFDAYVTKPIEPAKFVPFIEQFLKR